MTLAETTKKLSKYREDAIRYLAGLALKYNGEWFPNWSDPNEPKYGLVFTSGISDIQLYTTMGAYGCIYFKRREDAQDALEKLGYLKYFLMHTNTMVLVDQTTDQYLMMISKELVLHTEQEILEELGVAACGDIQERLSEKGFFTDFSLINSWLKEDTAVAEDDDDYDEDDEDPDDDDLDDDDDDDDRWDDDDDDEDNDAW